MPRSISAALLAAVLSVAALAQQRVPHLTTSSRARSARDTTACLTPPAGLVSWWPGDLNENDIIGGNDPSDINAVSLVPGEVLDGFTFGTQGYIQIPQSASLENQNFTWLAWVRPDGPGPNTTNLIINQDIDATNAAVNIGWRSADGRFTFLSGDATTDTQASADAFPPGSFYLVALSYDGSTFALYVNGLLEASLSESTTIPYSSSGWEFGSGAQQYFPNFPDTWVGVIDEVQVFSRALSQSEIQSIYDAAGAGECKFPAINPGGVISASDFGAFPSTSPGSWVEIYGSILADATRGWTAGDFDGVNAPIALEGTSVSIAGEAAFIDYISPGQVNALVPSDTPTGVQQMTITTPFGTSDTFNITVNPVEAGLLAPSSFNINGTQYAVAVYADGTYVLPTGVISGLSTQPAQPGDEIVLYGIGFGPVTPNIPAGQLVGVANTLQADFQISIAGVPCQVEYDGLAPNYTGLYQFNIIVPSGIPSGAAPLTFTVAGTPGTQTLYIAIQN